jgi:hypothetical protein
MDSGMKTITSLVFVVVAAACAACATHEPATSSTAPRTLPALPVPQTYTPSQLAALRRTPGGDYPGYQRIVIDDGQTRYCRRATADSQSDSGVVCLREAQLWAEQLIAQRQRLVAQEQKQLAAVAQLNALQDQSRTSGTTQLESQENSQAQVQSNMVNMPMH